jgi:hypothetical protein
MGTAMLVLSGGKLLVLDLLPAGRSAISVDAVLPRQAQQALALSTFTSLIPLSAPDTPGARVLIVADSAVLAVRAGGAAVEPSKRAKSKARASATEQLTPVILTKVLDDVAGRVIGGAAWQSGKSIATLEVAAETLAALTPASAVTRTFAT